jgi:fermentation-respiration switch protein FrsA (DUF1100 family)
MKALKVLAGLVLCLYAAFLGCLFVLQRALIYPGTHIAVPGIPPSAPGLEVISLQTSSGSGEAIFLPAPTDERQPVVIFGHGNGEVIDFWVASFGGFRVRGIGVLLVEYPGYGRSSGSPSQDSIRTTMAAAYDHIAADPRVDKDRIFGYGQSLGGGVICLLAKERPLRALILQSTFTSLGIFASRYFAPSFLLRDRFDNISAIKGFRGPVLVIHGRDDRLIPWENGKLLAKSAIDGTFRLYECGHGCWDPERLPFWHDVDLMLLRAGLLGVERTGAQQQAPPNR